MRCYSAANGALVGVSLLTKLSTPGDGADRSVLFPSDLDVALLVLLVPGIGQQHGIGDGGKGHVQCNGGRRPVWAGNRRGVQGAELVNRTAVGTGYGLAIGAVARQCIRGPFFVVEGLDGAAT